MKCLPLKLTDAGRIMSEGQARQKDFLTSRTVLKYMSRLKKFFYRSMTERNSGY